MSGRIKDMKLNMLTRALWNNRKAGVTMDSQRSYFTCDKRAYMQGVMEVYDIIVSLPSVRTSISQDEIDRIDKWIENSLVTWVNNGDSSNPPPLEIERRVSEAEK